LLQLTVFFSYIGTPEKTNKTLQGNPCSKFYFLTTSSKSQFIQTAADLLF